MKDKKGSQDQNMRNINTEYLTKKSEIMHFSTAAIELLLGNEEKAKYELIKSGCLENIASDLVSIYVKAPPGHAPYPFDLLQWKQILNYKINEAFEIEKKMKTGEKVREFAAKNLIRESDRLAVEGKVQGMVMGLAIVEALGYSVNIIIEKELENGNFEEVLTYSNTGQGD